MPARIRLVADLTLPDGADADGFADSVFLFLESLEDPAPNRVHRVGVEYLPSAAPPPQP